MSDKFLGDSVLLFSAVSPCPLLTYVTIALMPLINAIEHLLTEHKNLDNNAVLSPSYNCGRCIRSRNNNPLQDILLHVLGAIVVLTTKIRNLVPFAKRFHSLNIDTHFPSIDNMLNIQGLPGANTF